MKKKVALLAGAVILTACGGGGGGGTATTSAVSGLVMPESMSVVSAQGGTTNNSASLMSAVYNVSGFPANSQYNTDRVNSYVYDESMESLDTVNMILCLMEQTRATDMVNQGAYIALVNEDKCEQGQNGNGGQQSTGQSSGGQATEFNNWTILSTRASNDDPQLVKIWVPGEEQSTDPMDAQTILIEVSVNEGVSSTAPFGRFVMNFKGVADMQGNAITTMKGTLKTIPNNMGKPHFNFINTGGDLAAGTSGVMNFSFQESSDVILDDVNGTGGIALTQSSFSQIGGSNGDYSDASTYAVAFNDSYLYRGRDNNPVANDGLDVKQCTDRTDFNSNVWRYNLYHTSGGTFNGQTVTAGQRVELNSGFPFEYDSTPGDGNSVNDAYGWIGYHGIWSENENTIVDGSTITQFDYANDTTKEHTVHISDGKLIRRTANTILLSELVGEEFQWWGMHPTLPVDGQWIVRVAAVNNSNYDKFEIIAKQSWGDNGPTTSTTVNGDTVVAIITLQNKEWIGFWSDALGGSLDYVFDADISSVDASAKFYGQENVSPSDTIFDSGAITFFCYERCLIGGIDQAAVDTAVNGNGADDLYYKYQTQNLLAPYQYTLSIVTGKMVLTDETAGQPVNMAALDLSALGHNWGINTGQMIIMALDDPTSPWLVMEKPVTYSWETGKNQWNRLVTVTDDANGDFTSFDAPMSFNYTHAIANDENDASTTNPYDGSKFLLEYGGVGQLWGFPWVQQGSSPDGRWNPAVTLRDGVELTDKDGTVFVVKAVEKEQSMKSVNASNCTTAPNALSIDNLFTTLSLPAPSDIGTVTLTRAEKPVVTDAPAVIEGELQ